jgi:hypothetical protein
VVSVMRRGISCNLFSAASLGGVVFVVSIDIGFYKVRR